MVLIIRAAYMTDGCFYPLFPSLTSPVMWDVKLDSSQFYPKDTLIVSVVKSLTGQFVPNKNAVLCDNSVAAVYAVVYVSSWTLQL